MAMGKRKREQQPPLFVGHDDLPKSQGHPFYVALNQLLKSGGFDDWVEEVCATFYKGKMGRPSMAPGIYFRCVLVGYFEGIDSERGIAWRVADSLSLRSFLGLGLTDSTPDHSTISRTRRLIDIETHQRVFTWVLKAAAVNGLISGKTAGIDGTTLEANAALRSIVRNDNGQRYQEFLTELAKASGIETPTREDLARIDRNREKKGSNDDWHNPHDPDAKIAKMKDGSTHLAHKQEHAVDMETGAVLAVTIQPANQGDTTTWRETTEAACTNVNALIADPVTKEHVNPEAIEEVVTDKGYHANQVMVDMDEVGIVSYASEPKRGNRNWKNKEEERIAVEANGERVRSDYGKELLRKRGEKVERSFAHVLETGGMRRTHLRGHQNILKRMLIHVAGFNLGLVMRKVTGRGTPRGLQGGRGGLFALVLSVLSKIVGDLDAFGERRERSKRQDTFRRTAGWNLWKTPCFGEVSSATGC
jgi:transposase